MKRALLFLTFIWRESPGGGRVNVSAAWALAGIWAPQPQPGEKHVP